MTEFSSQIVTLPVPIHVDMDLGVDVEGKACIVTFIDADEDNMIEASRGLEEVLDELLSYWRDSDPSEAYSVLSTLAYALDEASGRCWDMLDELEGTRVEQEAERFPAL
jgi:hypothetical protein